MNKFFILLIGFSLTIAAESNIIKMELFNLQAALAEDANRAPNTPERYAYSFNTDINFFEEGNFETLDNGDKIWRLRIQSENAIGMKLYFNEFYLPDGSSLNIYSNEMKDMTSKV